VRVEGNAGVGTGFIVSEDGRIATNLHVILGSKELNVTMADGTKVAVSEVVSFRREYDLAIVKIAPPRALTVAPLGNSQEVTSGDPVVAIGNPLGDLDFTVSNGIISSVREINDVRVLQTTAPISVGSSGGPLFNSYGEVVGITSFFAQGGQNLNFAMPSNYLAPMLSEQQTVSVEAFHEATSQLSSTPPRTKQKHPQVNRVVPKHEVSLLSGCDPTHLRSTYQGIQRAIQLGAPIYNRGEYEACFVVYRNAAKDMEKDTALCTGIRDALGQGLLRATSEDTPAAQAWAIRDAFDGLLTVIQRKAQEEP